MTILEEIVQGLFGESSPGGKFLLCLGLYVPLIMLKNNYRSKMSEIARLLDPSLSDDNPFAKVSVQNAEVWTDPKWRELRTKHSITEFASMVPALLGIWFGFESTILILGSIFDW